MIVASLDARVGQRHGSNRRVPVLTEEGVSVSRRHLICQSEIRTNILHLLVFVVLMMVMMVMFVVMVVVVIMMVMVMVMVVRRTLIVSFLDQAIRLVGHLCFLHRDDRIRHIRQRCGLGQTYVAESGNENCRSGKSEFD